MATVADLIARTQRHLYGMHKDELNLLQVALDASETTVQLIDQVTGLGGGTIICIDDELMYVREVQTPARTMSVLRGFRGSTATTHDAMAIVEVAPRFPKPYIRDMLQEEIASWPENVFRVASVPVSLAASSRGYDLTDVPTTHFGVVGFHLSPAASDTSRGWSRGPSSWRIERGLPTSEFPSGSALILDSGYAGRTVYLDVALPFDVSDFDDNVTTASMGLEDSMLDIPPMGVAWRVLAARETKRSFTEAQGEPLDAEAVPPMYQMQTAERFKRMRDGRLGEEAMRLRGRYPLRTL